MWGVLAAVRAFSPALRVLCAIYSLQVALLSIVTPDHHFALRILLAPDVHPEIESVVQVNIREER
jgi:hypothetical protein